MLLYQIMVQELDRIKEKENRFKYPEILKIKNPQKPL